MKKLLIAAIITLLPVSIFAETSQTVAKLHEWKLSSDWKMTSIAKDGTTILYANPEWVKTTKEGVEFWYKMSMSEHSRFQTVISKSLVRCDSYLYRDLQRIWFGYDKEDIEVEDSSHEDWQPTPHGSIMSATLEQICSTKTSNTYLPTWDETKPVATTTQKAPCDCPFNIAKDGSICGERSAYSLSGGKSPQCY